MKITDIITEAAIAVSMKKAGKKPKQDVAEGSVTPDVNVSKVHDDGHEKEWHI